MGNKLVKFDIISNLPPELVLTIISYLSVRDVARCTLVCKNWFNIVSNFGVFWKLGAENIGLTKDATLQCMPTFATPRDFFIAVKKYKKNVQSLKLIPSNVDHAVPSEGQFTLCLYANNGTIIRLQRTNHLYLGNQNFSNRLIVEKLCNLSYLSKTTHISTELSLHKDTKVVWAHMKGEYLYWISRCGIWSGYNLQTNQEAFRWHHPLLKEGSGITVACCNKCSLFVASHWVPTYFNAVDSHRSAYSLQIIRLQEGRIMSKVIVDFKQFQTNHSHNVFVQHDSRYWLRKAHILSSSNIKQDGVCKSHNLILQCDCCVMVQSLEAEHLDATNNLTIHISKPECVNCNFSMEYDESKTQVKFISSEVTLSSDKSLMGQVFDQKLYVWKFDEQQDTLPVPQERRLVTPPSIEVKSICPLQQQETRSVCKGVKIVALGHILSIVTYLDDTYVMEYRIHIVFTKTGEVLCEFRRVEKFYDWTFCCQIDPLHRFYFMICDGNSEWLDTVQCNIPDIPIVTVHNHHGKIHLEALKCNRTTAQTWRKHWRCAVNFGFHH